MRTMNRILSVMIISVSLLAGNVASGKVTHTASMALPYRTDYLKLWEADYDKYSVESAYNSLHDEFLVVWENVQGPDGIHDIYARRVSAKGQILNWFCVYTDNVNYKHHSQNPSVAYDEIHDRYLVTWSYFYGWVDPNNHDKGSDWDVKGRYVPWDGSGMDCSSMDPVFPISQSGSESESKPRVAYNPTEDQFLVVYLASDADNPPTTHSYVAVRTVTSGISGAPITVSSATADHDYPDVAYNSYRDEYLVVWDVYPSSLDVWAARLYNDGSVMWGDPGYPGEFPLAITTLNEQRPTVAACSQSNQYLVVWQQPPPPPNPRTDDDLYGKYLSWWYPAGYSISGTSWIEASTAPQREADLTCNADGNEYLVVWEDVYAGAGDVGIWGKLIRPTMTLTNPFAIIAPWGSPSKNREQPIASGGKTSYLVAWEHLRNADPSYRDIWGTVLMKANFLPLIRK